MKLIIHVGLPKTGTTSLQGFLRNNNDKLINHGYNYIENYQVLGRHQLILSNLTRGNETALTTQLKHIKENCTKGEIAIISSEGFSYQLYSYKNQEFKFSDICRKLDIEVECVVFLRDPIKLAWSLYRQVLINAPNNKTAPEFGSSISFETFLKLPKSKFILNYQLLTQSLRNQFSEKLTPILLGKDAISQFFEFLKLDSNDFPKSYTANTSIPSYAMSFFKKNNDNLKSEKLRSTIIKNRRQIFTEERSLSNKLFLSNLAQLSKTNDLIFFQDSYNFLKQNTLFNRSEIVLKNEDSYQSLEELDETCNYTSWLKITDFLRNT